MRFTLKDYQRDAARGVLTRLSDARFDVHERNKKIAFGLSATTGAGKTVIASAVIEALFRGSDEFDVEADPTAVILWVTDDPSLNEQTRQRITDSADRIPLGSLVTIENDFIQEKFDTGKLYFLNVQKLGTSSLLTKRVDKRQFTIWDTIKNTIEDKERTLYLVLDEAHRGMKESKATNGDARSTIVQKIINGHDDIPAVPIVWGISATLQRFEAAMNSAQIKDRTRETSIEVDAKAVQASGLLKDVILLDSPSETGDFETTLLRDAVLNFMESTERWGKYVADQKLEDPMLPLLVVQVPNKTTDKELVAYIDVIRQFWPDFQDDALAHVFGEHDDRTVGKYSLPYIEPQNVQDSSHIRVLFAKDAVSTGWDCPRAEVLFSLRPAVDKTHITQLLGRMVRTPLARRIPSDEMLNSVTCYLPKFDRDTVDSVVKRLTGEEQTEDFEGDGKSGRKILTDPITLHWNKAIPTDVSDFLSTLPSEPKPAAHPKPIKRLLKMAVALAKDQLIADANTAAHDKLFSTLDGLLAKNHKAVAVLVEDILTADISRVKVKLNDAESTVEETKMQRKADDRTVDDEFGTASRLLGKSVSEGYVTYLARKESGVAGNDPANDDDLDFYGAKAQVAALVKIEGVSKAVEDEADKCTKKWLDEYHVSISHLTDDRKDEYDEIRALAREPEHADTEIPTNIMEQSKDASGSLLPTEKLHILSDQNGDYPIGGLNEWEQSTVITEVNRKHTVAWYRNPSQATAHAIRVPYKSDGVWKSMQPDFIFITKMGDGSLAASIVDPHGLQFSDALPKLKGLAYFAEKHGDQFVRIDALAHDKGKKMVLLSMKDEATRKAVREALDAKSLFNSPLARTYN